MYILLAILVLTVFVLSTLTFADASNIVKNPGFEEGARYWEIPEGLAQIDTTVFHSGKASLRVAWDDPAKRRLTINRLPLRPGKRYLIKAWLKCENVHGALLGATFGIQWYSKEQFLGGAYPMGIGWGTDWTEITFLSDITPANVTNGEVFTCIDWGGVGTYWIDDISVQEIDTLDIFRWHIENDTVVGSSDSPAFRVVVDHIKPEVFGMDVEVSVNLCSPPWGASATEYKIKPQTGTKIDIPTGEINEGLWKITCCIKSKPGKELMPRETRSVWKRLPVQALIVPHSGILLPNTGFPSISIRPYRNGTVSGEIAGVGGESILKIAETKVTIGKDSLIKLPGQPEPGKYEIRLRMASSGHADYNETLPFTVLTPEEAAKATVIGPDNLLYRQGKPYFPMLFYGLTAIEPGKEEQVERIPSITKDMLDHLEGTPFGILDYCTLAGGLDGAAALVAECEKRNIPIGVSVKDVYSGYEKTKVYPARFPGMSREQIVRSVAQKLRNSPAVVFYYTDDELSTDFYHELKEQRKWLHEEDPLHPTLHVHYDLECIRELSPAFDIYGSELYPWRNPDDLTEMARWCDISTSALPATAPFWGCLWVFADTPWGDARERSLAYTAIAKGAKGFVLYCYHDLRASKKFDIRWKQMVALGNEIQERLPILLQPEDRRPCKTSTPGFTLKTYSGKEGKWLLAINNLKKTHTAEIDLNGHIPLNDISDTPITDGYLQLRFAPFEVKLIRLRR